MKKSEDTDVTVELTYTYPSTSFDPIIDQDGSDLNIKEEFNTSTTKGQSFWVLSIPDDMVVNFVSGSGGFIVNDVNIKTTSKVGSGDIEFNQVSGSHTVRTGSGSIDLDGVAGTFKVNAGSGDLDLQSSTGSFEVNVGSGNIFIEESEAKFAINVGSGDINASDIKLSGQSAFNSGSGDAEIELAGQLNHDISVNSGSGDAILDFDGVKISGEITMEANKSNGKIEAPFSFDEIEEESVGSNIKICKKARIGNSTVRINVSTGSGLAKISK